MNRARRKNKGLPRRVYLTDGSYRFKPIAPMVDPRDGKLKTWITLARAYEGEPAMLKALAAILNTTPLDTSTMPYLCAEFKQHKLGKYGLDTQDAYGRYLSVIAGDFEEFRVDQVTTKVCADFLRNRFRGKANTAQKYSALMRKLFRYAISELGLRQDNPIDQLDLSDYETTRREVLPTHEQIKAIREAGMLGIDGRPTQSGPMFACIIDMTYLCWQRLMDMRMLKESQIVDGRIKFAPTKTKKSSGKSVDIIITPVIQEVIDRARQIKKDYGIISPYLMPSKKGTPYKRTGWSSMWDRAKERAGVTEGIQLKDIRALAATDAARQGGDRKEIQKKLVHTTGKTTEIYIKEAFPETSEMQAELPWESR